MVPKFLLNTVAGAYGTILAMAEGDSNTGVVACNRRRVFLPLLIIAFLTLPAFCRKTEQKNQTLRILLWDSPVSSNPNQEFDSVTDSVLFNVFEPLVSLDTELELVPCLAVSWSNPKPEIWRFQLRQNVRFHDGSFMNAESVRAALMEVKTRNFETSTFLSAVREIAVIDEHTIDLITTTPSALLSKLPFVYIVKTSSGQKSSFLGTGPFQLLQWNPPKEITMKMFEGYWGKHPLFGEVHFSAVRDAEQRFEILENGQADISYFSPSHILQKNVSGIQLFHHEGLAVYYLGFDLQNPVFQDLRIRQAIHLAIDRRRIIEHALGGYGSIPTQPVAPFVFGFDPAIPVPEYNLEKARALIREAGHAERIQIRLDASDSRSEIAKMIREDLVKIGIDVELNILSRNDVYTLAENGKSAFFLVGWDCSSGDASEFYEFNLRTPFKGYGQGNYGKYSNAELDEICEKQQFVLSDPVRKQMLQRAAQIVMRDLPVIPIFMEDDVYAVRKNVYFEPRAEGQVKVLDVRFQK